MIPQESHLWQYLIFDQRMLASDGDQLLRDIYAHPNEHLSDYSYLVFPFAKLYEGFLKQLLLDIGAIGERDYHSDHFRIGKALSPNMARLLGSRSAYSWITRRYSESLAQTLWATWKNGRNLIFHYFPHNIRRLTLSEAEIVIRQIISAMEMAIEETHISGLASRER